MWKKRGENARSDLVPVEGKRMSDPSSTGRSVGGVYPLFGLSFALRH